jgi:hypothetical protein
MMAFEWKGQKKLARQTMGKYISFGKQKKSSLVSNYDIGLLFYLIFILWRLRAILQNMIAYPVKTAEVKRSVHGV